MTAEQVVDMAEERQKRDLSERQKYRQAQLARAKRDSDARMGLTEGKESLLEKLHPPVFDNKLTSTQVCEYLGISKSTLIALTRVHNSELKAVGFVKGHQHAQSRYSRRAVIHLALMVRPSTSQQANAIKKQLGVYQPPRNGRARWASHVASCMHVIAKTMEIAQAVQETDPQEVWDELSGLDRWQLQATIIALGSMLPLDEEGLLKYLTELGEQIPMSEFTNKRGSGASRGLAALLPVTHQEYDEDAAAAL